MPDAQGVIDRAHRHMGRLARIFIGLGFALLVCVRPTYDPDIWWHLRTGAEALARRSTLPFDLFSFSYAGAPWPYKDLVGEVVLAAGFQALGFVWLAALKAGAFVLLAWALWGARRPRERGEVGFLLCLGALVVLVPIDERPNVFSQVVFLGVLALLERARRLDGAASPVRTWLPVLAMVWLGALVHRGATLAPLVIGGFGVTLVAVRAVGRWPALAPLAGETPSWRLVGAAFAAAVGSSLIVMLNPSGAAIWRSTMNVTSSAVLREHISQWLRLGPAALVRTFPWELGLGVAVLVAAAARLARASREARRVGASRSASSPTAAAPTPSVTAWHVGLVGAALAATLDSVRWVPYLALAAIFVAARLLGELEARVVARRPRGVVALAAVAVLSLVWAQRSEPWRLGEPRDAFPAGAVAFAREHRLEGRIVNAFSFGGYVMWTMWPRSRVLVDGRNDTVYPPSFIVRCLRAERDAGAFRAMRDEDHATIVIASNRMEGRSHLFLADDPAWALVYLDEAAAVYVERGAHPELEPLRFRFVSPAAIDVSVIRAVKRNLGSPARLEQVEAELRRLLVASPDGVRANAALVLYYHTRGAAFDAQRDAALRHLVAVAGRHPAVRELQRRIALGQRP